MKNNSLKNIVIAVLVALLVLTTWFGFHERQAKVSIQQQTSGKVAKLDNGDYKIEGNLKGKKAVIKNDKMIIDGGKVNYLLVRGVNKENASVKNVVAFQNVAKHKKNENTAGVFSVRQNGDKFDFYNVKAGKVEGYSFTLTRN